MIKTSISLHQVIDFLNEAAKIDPVAVRTLFTTKHSCNEQIAVHPTIQVGTRRVNNGGDLTEDLSYTLGPLGLLNGLFGTFPEDHPTHPLHGPVTTVLDTDGGIRFELTAPVVACSRVGCPQVATHTIILHGVAGGLVGVCEPHADEEIADEGCFAAKEPLKPGETIERCVRCSHPFVWSRPIPAPTENVPQQVVDSLTCPRCQGESHAGA